MIKTKPKRESDGRWSKLAAAALFDPDVSAEGVRVLGVLGYVSNAEEETYAGTGYIARRLGRKQRVIQKHMKILIDKGYVEASYRPNGEGGTRRWFRLKYPEVPEAEAYSEDASETHPEDASDTHSQDALPDDDGEPIRTLATGDTHFGDTDTHFGDKQSVLPGRLNKPMNQPIKNKPMNQPLHAMGLDASGEYSVGEVKGGTARVIGDIQPDHQQHGRSKTKGTRLPDEVILPEEWRTIIQERRPDLNAEQVFEGFKRYFTGPDATHPVKKDWTRAWINWFERERHGQPNRNQSPGRVGAAAAGIFDAVAGFQRRGDLQD